MARASSRLLGAGYLATFSLDHEIWLLAFKGPISCLYFEREFSIAISAPIVLETAFCRRAWAWDKSVRVTSRRAKRFCAERSCFCRLYSLVSATVSKWASRHSA